MSITLLYRQSGGPSPPITDTLTNTSATIQTLVSEKTIERPVPVNTSNEAFYLQTGEIYEITGEDIIGPGFEKIIESFRNTSISTQPNNLSEQAVEDIRNTIIALQTLSESGLDTTINISILIQSLTDLVSYSDSLINVNTLVQTISDLTVLADTLTNSAISENSAIDSLSEFLANQASQQNWISEVSLETLLNAAFLANSVSEAISEILINGNSLHVSLGDKTVDDLFAIQSTLSAITDSIILPGVVDELTSSGSLLGSLQFDGSADEISSFSELLVYLEDSILEPILESDGISATSGFLASSKPRPWFYEDELLNEAKLESYINDYIISNKPLYTEDITQTQEESDIVLELLMTGAI